MLLAGGIGFAVLGVLVDAAYWSAAAAFVFSILVLSAFRKITVTIDRRELVVRYAPPVPVRHRIERKEIESVEVIDDVRPMKWGGWGYRGSRILFRRAAVVIRRGPGLRITTRDGRTLAITVDDPEGALAVLRS